MTTDTEITIDPWVKQPQPASLPSDLIFLCSYDLKLGPDSVEEGAFYRRADRRDELWVTAEPEPALIEGIASANASPDTILAVECLSLGCAVRVAAQGRKDAAGVKLLDTLFRARIGHGWPGRMLREGTLKQRRFTALIRRIKKELDDNRAKNRTSKAEIIDLAEALGLYPEPSGTQAGLWKANCPNSQHRLLISPEHNEFFCGYCKRSGNPNQLGAFVAERRPSRSTAVN